MKTKGGHIRVSKWETTAHILSEEVLAIAVNISAVPIGFSSSIDVVEKLQPFFV